MRYNFETTYEDIGYPYPQPIERVNGKKYFDYSEGSIERRLWAALYWKNRQKKLAKALCFWECSFWNNEDSFRTLRTIYKYILKKQQEKDFTAATQLLTAEIFLITKGFKLQMGGLNAVTGGRCYRKGNITIITEYGISMKRRNQPDFRFIKFAFVIYNTKTGKQTQFHHIPTKEKDIIKLYNRMLKRNS